MDVVHPRVCGMDVSKTDAKVCVRTQQGTEVTREVTTWSAVSSQVLVLGEYLVAQQVTLVVMEATGDYWKPFYFLLSQCGLEVMLANARAVRQIPGRKTDVSDAQWLADLGAHGLVRGSFVPPAHVRVLRDLVRARTTLVRLRGQSAQRLEKVLESAGIKLSATISNLMGVTGRRMLAAMVAGQDDPAVLAQLADPRIQASQDELREALTGRFTDHHQFLVEMHLDLIDGYTTKIEALEARIDACFTGADDDPDPVRQAKADLDQACTLLVTIPGIDTTTAQKILAETGADMSVFPTAKNLTSWAGVAPGANQSAGKTRSTKCPKGDTYLKGALGIAVKAVVKSEDTFFAARFARVRSRRGYKAAVVALERSMLVAVWTVLTTGKPYVDPGGDYYARRKPGKAIAKGVSMLRAAGMNVTFTSTDAVVVT